jgi:SAM-dependent methyltransferase
VYHVRERWRSGWLEATVDDSVVGRERLVGVLGRLIWGTDTSAFCREIARLAQEPDGTAILDVPCGGGVAFRGLRPGQRVPYVAADLSPVMLRRALAEANRRDLDQIEFVEADVDVLPFDDASFDLCVSYTGLHCFPDPVAAVSEIARIRRAGLRQDAFVRLHQVAGVFGPGATFPRVLATRGGLTALNRRGNGIDFGIEKIRLS